MRKASIKMIPQLAVQNDNKIDQVLYVKKLYLHLTTILCILGAFFQKNSETQEKKFKLTLIL